MCEQDTRFIEALVERVPALATLMRDHLRDWDELLTHIFMSELTRWVVDRRTSHGPDDEVLRTTLDFIEDSFDAAPELIAVSFVENLPYADEEGIEIKDLLGPKLRNELEVQRPGEA